MSTSPVRATTPGRPITRPRLLQNLRVKSTQEAARVNLHLDLPDGLPALDTPLVSTELLGKARIPDFPFENPDGSAIKLNTDYFNKVRSEGHPTPGPFETLVVVELTYKVW